MKIGRYILAAVIAMAAAKYVGTAQEEYSTNCTAEYIDTAVINKETTLTLPKTLTTYEQCNIRVSFNSAARQDYYSFTQDERQTFSIKARRNGDFVTVYSVYKDDAASLRTIRLALSKSIIYENGYGDGQCFNAYYEKLCFKSKDLYSAMHRDVRLYDAVVDTAGNISKLTQVKQ